MPKMAAITANAIRRLESTLAVTSAMRPAFPVRSGCRAKRTVSCKQVRSCGAVVLRAVVVLCGWDLFEENEKRSQA